MSSGTYWRNSVTALLALLMLTAATPAAAVKPAAITDQAVNKTACPGPYHVVAPDGRCVWSCGTGTQPDNASGECLCKPDYVEAGRDRFGRRVCREARAPDLVIKDAQITQTADCAARKAVLNVTATIINIGNATAPAASGFAMVNAMDQHQNWGNGKIVNSPIAAGASKMVTFPVYYLASDPAHMTDANPHPFLLRADPGNNVVESDETNNGFGPLQVTVGPHCGVQAQDKIVFVSSQTYTGNFGNGQITLGHLIADQRCQDLADAAGLIGSYKAWISGRAGLGHGAADRFTHSGDPYRLVDGTKVADNWGDLTDGSLDHAIDRTELGGTVTAGTRVWTNTTSSGAAWDSSRNCAPGLGPDVPGVASWSCGAPTWTPGDCQFESGKYGLATSSSASWTGTGSSNVACNNSYRLYCFQQ